MADPANDNHASSPPVGNEPGGKPCPICGRPEVARSRPFCSARCADIDLHRWLGGTYAIAAASDDSSAGDADRSGVDP